VNEICIDFMQGYLSEHCYFRVMMSLYKIMKKDPEQ